MPETKEEDTLYIGLIHKEGIQSPTSFSNLVAGHNDRVACCLGAILSFGDIGFLLSVVIGDTRKLKTHPLLFLYLK